MSIGELLRAVRKLWWVVLLCFMAGTGGGAYLAYTAVPKYASTVTFFVTTPSTGSGSALQGDQFGQERVNSYVKLLGSQRVAQAIVSKVPGLSLPYVMTIVTGEADLNTVLLTATVTDNSASRSLAIATVLSNEFPNIVDQIESLNGKKVAPVQLVVISGPSGSTVPVSPNKKTDIGIAAILGLSVGFAFAVLRKVFDTTIRSAEELRTLVDIAVLGVVTKDKTSKKSPLITAGNLQTLRAESFRQLRTNLRFVDIDEPARVIVITSSMAGEGKSSTSVNLAIAFAQAGSSVLLIDGDLRRPKIADYLGIEGAVGLTNVLAGQVDVGDVIQVWGKTTLGVLPAGSIPPNPSELLGSHHMQALVGELRRQYDMIIIDTPPLLPVTDASVVAAYADGTVLVVRYGSTKRALVEAAVNNLRAVDARVLGAILNFSPTKGADAERPYSGYGYYSSETKKATIAARRRGEPRRASSSDAHSPADDDGKADEPARSTESVGSAEASRPAETAQSSGRGRRTRTDSVVDRPTEGTVNPATDGQPADDFRTGSGTAGAVIRNGGAEHSDGSIDVGRARSITAAEGEPDAEATAGEYPEKAAIAGPE